MVRYDYVLEGLIAAATIFYVTKTVRRYYKNKSKINITEKETELEMEKLEFHSYKDSLKWTRTKDFSEKWGIKMYPDEMVLIDMELSNGDHTRFVANIGKGVFKRRNKSYIFDTNAKYYIHSEKMNGIDYHENFVLPIKRKIPYKKMQDNMQLQGKQPVEVEYATNPQTLQKFLDSNIMEAIMQGQQITVWMKQIRMFVIIGMIIGAVHLLIFAIKTGMFSGIHL